MSFRKTIHLVVLFIAGSFLIASCVSMRKRFFAEPEVVKIGAVEYWPLESVKKIEGIDYDWNPHGQEAVLKREGRELKVRGFHPYVYVHGEDRRLLFPPIFRDNKLYIPRELAEFPWWEDDWLVSREARVFWDMGKHRIARVVLDAGHGGPDDGASYFGSLEKEVVLDIALRVKERLEMYGIQVLMTREADEYLSLPDRAWIGNVVEPDFFLSLHANAAPHGEASGIETYYARQSPSSSAPDPLGPDAEERLKLTLTPNPFLDSQMPTEPISETNRKRSRLLAQQVHEALKQGISPVEDRGVKEAGFYLLRWIDAPAALVEVGFISHQNENLRLSNTYYRTKIARAIADGLLDYLMKPPA
ncbi:MAG: N-acetylmuramoyl-L-alanine amidase family protein [Candidatus Omnitrophota bacterium]